MSDADPANPHTWETTTAGQVDMFAYDPDPSGAHNGPRCTECGLAFCEYCDPELIESECPAEEVPADGS